MEEAANEYAQLMLANWAEQGGDMTALLIELTALINEIRNAAQLR